MPEPLRLDLGPARAGAACETVRIEAAPMPGVPAPEGPVEWRVVGFAAPDIARDGPAAARLRLPVFARETPLVVEARAPLADGTEALGRQVITVAGVAPAPGQSVGLAPDCAPFREGVASGDPLPDGVVLWTRVSPADLPADGISVDGIVTLRWQVARDVWFDDLAAEGMVDAGPSTDHTAVVEVQALEPGRRYFYRFVAPDGRRSMPGRTATAPRPAAPGEPMRPVRLATMSCSSVFSGWFNAYRRVAERDVDLVVHLGDYVYDFVDGDERVRVPEPPPPDPTTTAEWRDRHRYYLADPDLRAARAAHPWVVIWDNHDVDEDDGGAEARPVEVFREYVPMRRPAPDDPRIAYRSLRFGDVHLTLLDTLLHRTADDMLGAAQWAFVEGLWPADPPAAWRVVGSQKLLAPLVVPGDAIEVGNWEDHPASRARLLAALGAVGPDNVVLSGDLHFTIAADLVGAGGAAVGVELLAASISRGNFDETICSGLCDDAALRGIESIRGLIARANPHIAALELVEHGYGVVEFGAERAVATMYYSPIRGPSDAEVEGPRRVVERGAGRWTRQ